MRNEEIAWRAAITAGPTMAGFPGPLNGISRRRSATTGNDGRICLVLSRLQPPPRAGWFAEPLAIFEFSDSTMYWRREEDNDTDPWTKSLRRRHRCAGGPHTSAHKDQTVYLAALSRTGPKHTEVIEANQDAVESFDGASLHYR